MTAACDLLSVERGLDRIEAHVARELPVHMQEFAYSYAMRWDLPSAPEVLLRPTTLAIARAALAHPVLAERGLILLRLAAPIAIDADPVVTAARAAPVRWAALAALIAARDAAADAQFGRRAIDVLHRLHGVAADDDAVTTVSVGARAGAGELPPPIASWTTPDGRDVDFFEVVHVWSAGIAALRPVTPGQQQGWSLQPRSELRPRTFVVAPGREVVATLPSELPAPADRFAVLHELGHTFAALVTPAGIPRVLDEAIAAYVARAIEREDHPWYSPLAVAARARRLALARVLDRIERALPAITHRIAELPPWALWHDPGAQAAYVAAEAIADRLVARLGPSPTPAALIAAIADERAVIDRRDTGL